MLSKFIQQYLVPVISFIVVLGLVLILTSYFNANLTESSNQRLNKKVSDISQSVNSNFSIYVNFIKDVQGLFASSDNVSREEFSTFMTNIDFTDRYPGINTIGFTKKVTRDEKQNFVDDLNNDPLLAKFEKHYSIFPETDKDTYFVSDYAFPYDEMTLFGFDITTSPERFITATQAINTGKSVMTEKISLIGKYEGEYGFNIYVPIYKKGSTSTIEERSNNVMGVVIANFRLNNAFKEIFRDETIFSDLSLKIFTNGKKTDDYKLYDSNTRLDSDNILSINQDQTIAGRQWNLEYSAKEGYGLNDTERIVPVVTLTTGLILGLIASFYLYKVRKSQNNALEQTSQIKVQLTESEAKLNNVLEAIDLIVFAIDNKGIFTLSVGKGLSELGLKQNEQRGLSIFDIYKENPEYTEVIKKALKGEQLTGRVKQGAIIYETRFTPIFDKNEKIVSVVGVSQNITAREETYTKLKIKTDESERLNKIMIDRELKMKELKKQIQTLS
ncbi:MAG: CHASE domain-containing protein [Candidatus Dojkabacteria bacterium]